MFQRTVMAALLSVLLAQGILAQIDQARLEVNLRTLAADDMNGRAAGTADARKAAAFIAGCYKDAGLLPYQGSDSLLQQFEVTNIHQEGQTLVLNGVAVDPASFAIISNQLKASVTDPSALKIFAVGETDKLRPVMSEARRYVGPKLLLLHTAHTEQVNSFMSYLRRPIEREQGEPDSMTIIVLSDNPEVTSLEARADNREELVKMANVIGVLPGKERPEEIVLFSAHYDHIGNLAAVDGDTIANGADDDASGVVALIELASYFREKGNARTLIFAAFTAEELGGYGSRHMCTTIDPKTIVAGVNIEMIGKPTKWGSEHAFITGYEKSTLPALMAASSGEPPRLHPDPYPEQQLFLRSDNASFARLGVPAHTVSAGKINEDPHYHKVSDEVDTLDLKHLTTVVGLIAKGVTKIVSGEETPTRLDPESVGRR